jgi:predicted RNA-binding Zn ribbon-like protein
MRNDWTDDGGRPSLDFVNTLRDRREHPRETVENPAELRDWLAWAGLLSGPAQAADAHLKAAHLKAARLLREAADRGLLAVAGGSLPSEDDLGLLNAAAARAPSAPLALVITDDRLEPRQVPRRAGSVEGALGLVAMDALELMISPEVRRVRICGAADCGLRFLDRSPAGNRRWCSMTRCGNRMKARLHQERTRRGALGTGEFGPAG